MSPIQLTRAFVVVVVIGLIAVIDIDARSIDEQELAKAARNVQDELALLEDASTNMDQINVDDDDLSDNEESRPLEGSQLNTASANHRYQAVPPSDLKTSASHHHHGHGAKGWLDMGAWTGKKGAFGWYDKHPVGGKKGK